MMLRRAKKNDFEEYLKLKRLEEKEYSKIIAEKLVYPKDFYLRKEFLGILNSKKDFLFFVENNKKLVGYLQGNLIRTIYSSYGYISDIFVLKTFRRKGIATILIKRFIKTIKNMGYKKMYLKINVRNKRALKLYKNLGFDIKHYNMRKQWK
ncbi:MAG: GNAT family N-acetyltransferase [Nanoarchaeota archaeon]